MNSYIRINRPELVIDTNLEVKGSLTKTIDSPIHNNSGHTFLLNRISGPESREQKPTRGFKFTYPNNTLFYIEFPILSSKYNDYNIVIKGEGNDNLLAIDTSNEYIRLKCIKTPTTSEYYFISYIVFVNKTTNKIEHLFECEESDPKVRVLLDACSQYGEYASIKYLNEANVNRASSPTKEYLPIENAEIYLNNSTQHCYGSWLNNVGYSTIGRYTVNTNTLGCDIKWNDIHGTEHTGWDGGIAERTYTPSGSTSPVTVQVQVGGRGIPSDGTTDPITLTTSPNLFFNTDWNNDYCSMYLNGLNPEASINSRSCICCENRDLSQDSDKPDCIKYAINYLQYTNPGSSWCNFCFNANYGNKLKSFLDQNNYPTSVNGRYRFKYSIWFRKLSTFPYWDTSNEAKLGIGLVSATESMINLKSSDYSFDTWIYKSGEFYSNTRAEYYWHFATKVAAWYYETNVKKWTTNEPLVAIANPMISLVAVYDPNDHTKLWDIPEKDYIAFAPRQLIS